MDSFVSNYYGESFIYTVFIIILSFVVIGTLKNKKLLIMDRLEVKNIDFLFLAKWVCFAFFIRILFEQFGYYFNFSYGEKIFDLSFLFVIVFFAVRCVIAPIFEEIFFRFGIFELINKRLNPFLSIIIVSLLFSILHFVSFLDTLILFSVSLVWNYAYLKKSNLVYPIIMHFCHNLYALISYINSQNIYYIVFGIICLVLFCIIVNLEKMQKRKL